MEYISLEIKIPEKRIAVLIGTKGATKKALEKAFNCKLRISSEGDIEISASDTAMALRAKEAVTAIARGFSPEHAMILTDEEHVLEIISLIDYAGTSEKALERFRSRLIGTHGKARANIEEISETHISISGKTVAILGAPENVKQARDAIELLLSGKTHKTSYLFLRKQKEREKVF
ncbi:MAG: KH domain-containing protein [Nanoarchaeota archaeon]|nr:KH domain-containing protein [Nanoarchaeota archaeon]MBU4451902.1 KH domain-containing protein [Nanoarchaeota archaeon]MCG2724612.1 KH domain-containing protein [archaeon]